MLSMYGKRNMASSSTTAETFTVIECITRIKLCYLQNLVTFRFHKDLENSMIKGATLNSEKKNICRPNSVEQCEHKYKLKKKSRFVREKIN